jgi:uncharacterized cupredoxin-like copper-binding protein
VTGARAVLVLAPVLVLIGAGLTGCSDGGSTVGSAAGSAGSVSAGAAPVLVPVEMGERRFSPASFSFRRGTVVIFRFHNGGAQRHQAVVGDVAVQQDRVDGQLLPGDPLVNTVLVEPGQDADLPYRMDVPGELRIGCHEAGHWAAGMKATITVTPTG